MGACVSGDAPAKQSRRKKSSTIAAVPASSCSNSVTALTTNNNKNRKSAGSNSHNPQKRDLAASKDSDRLTISNPLVPIATRDVSNSKSHSHPRKSSDEASSSRPVPPLIHALDSGSATPVVKKIPSTMDSSNHATSDQEAVQVSSPPPLQQQQQQQQIPAANFFMSVVSGEGANTNDAFGSNATILRESDSKSTNMLFSGPVEADTLNMAQSNPDVFVKQDDTTNASPRMSNTNNDLSVLQEGEFPSMDSKGVLEIPVSSPRPITGEPRRRKHSTGRSGTKKSNGGSSSALLRSGPLREFNAGSTSTNVNDSSQSNSRDLPFDPLSLAERRRIDSWIDKIDCGWTSCGPLLDPMDVTNATLRVRESECKMLLAACTSSTTGSS